jgi:pyridoxal phosphate enzyme (YggS family)
MSVPPSDLDVAGRLAAVTGRLQAAARRAGRPAGAVRLVAVTKGVRSDAIAAALEAGVSELAESRAQELLAKVTELAGGQLRGHPEPRPFRRHPEPRLVWHFVGRIQRNKVTALAPLVDLWQSVDRAVIGEAIARRAPGARVLVEVNVAADPAKAGCRPEEAPALVDGLRTAGLAVEGLMTVPRLGEDPRPAFSALRELGSRLDLSELSMGMSDDFEAAVEEGATIVRLGRAIFGSRAGPDETGGRDPRPGAPSLQR